MMLSFKMLRWLVTVKRTALRVCQALAQHLRQDSDPRESPCQAARTVIRGGLWLAFILFGIGGVWSATAPLDSAAVAPGQIMVDSKRKLVQHLEGGIVEEILVKEGDKVEAGQILVRLQGTSSRAKHDSLSSQYFAARAAEARLLAERDGKDNADYSSLVPGKDIPSEKLEVLGNQDKIFAARRKAFQSQASIIDKKISEYGHEIEGLQALVKAQDNQIAMLTDEISTARDLFAKGYSTKTRLVALQRESESLSGERGKNKAAIAKIEQSIAEAELQRVNLQEERMADTVKELKDVQLLLADLQEQMRASGDVLQRVAITSPLTGYVTNLNIHTVGGVVAPGEKLMEIVPDGDKLVIEAHVSPQDIDVVYPGLVAHVRLTAYKTAHIPTVGGTVTTVSADRITDNNTNTSYYLARIETDAEQLARLKHIKLYPGMPADVLIVTGSRTLLSYLFAPILDTLNKSFREE